MTKPAIRKHGNSWNVYINDHMYASRATHADAWAFAEGVAGYARRIRTQRDINRIHASLERIKAATERTEESSLAAQYRTGPGRGMTNANRATIAQLKESR